MDKMALWVCQGQDQILLQRCYLYDLKGGVICTPPYQRQERLHDGSGREGNPGGWNS